LATCCGQNKKEATLFVLQQIYISVYVRVGFISLNESSVHGYESLKSGERGVGRNGMMCTMKGKGKGIGKVVPAIY
jgi:hypothetical protein